MFELAGMCRTKKRKAHPMDASDEERASANSCLSLLPEKSD